MGIHPVLILTRALNERIFIGDDVILTVVKIRQGKVMLGIEAPKTVPINREDGPPPPPKKRVRPPRY